MPSVKSFIYALLCILLSIVLEVSAKDIFSVKDIDNILPERERARIMNEWLEWRLNNILPRLMEQEGIDIWLVICREPNEDPVYLTLVPEPLMSAWRTSILIFHYRKQNKNVDRYSANKPSMSKSMHSISSFYEGIWIDPTKTRFENLATFIKKNNPQKIAINISENWSFGDGLSVGFKNKLERALGSEYVKRLVPADKLCVAWLETRSPQELSVYRYICGISHDIIKEFFSNRVIVPDITTTEDVAWWIRQKITDLGLKTWFHPSISIIRYKSLAEQYANTPSVIRRGDLLHSDMGITYLGLCTDMQWNAYVCKTGEDEAPNGLNEALNKLHKLREIFFKEFKTGRTGNDITEATLEKAKLAGLQPSVYSHPIGYHGHGAGCSMDGRPPNRAPEGYQQRGEYPLYPNTVYAIEFSNATKIPEWDNQEITLGFEDEGIYTLEGIRSGDGYQSKLLLIK